jgi:hypothetical protein
LKINIDDVDDFEVNQIFIEDESPALYRHIFDISEYQGDILLMKSMYKPMLYGDMVIYENVAFLLYMDI